MCDAATKTGNADNDAVQHATQKDDEPNLAKSTSPTREDSTKNAANGFGGWPWVHRVGLATVF